MAERPKRQLLRAGWFFLSSGRAGGISLSVLLLLLETAIVMVADLNLTLRAESKSAVIISLYALFYCLFAVVLNRFFPKINTILGFVISVALWFILPAIACGSYAMIKKLPDEAAFEYMFTTPLYIFAKSDTALLLDKRFLLPFFICVFLMLPLCKYIVVEFIHFVKDEEDAA